MKFTKTNTTIALLSAVTISTVLFDIFAGFKGQKNRLWSSLRSSLITPEKTESVDKKLNEISTNIKSLTNRLTKVEESMSKLDSKIEKKVGFPIKSESIFQDMSLSNDSSFEGHKTERSKDQDEFFPLNIKHDHFSTDFDKHANNPLDLQKQLKIIQGIESSFGIPDGFSFEKPKEPKIHTRHTKRAHREEKKSKVTALNHEKPSPIEKPSLDSNEKTSPKKDNLPLITSNQEVVTFNSNPKTSNQTVKKMEITFTPDTPTKVIHVDSTKPINFSEIFTDISKDDPVIEVKRFDDYNDFKKYGESITNRTSHKDNDSAGAKFFRMSEIINFDKSNEAKSFEQVQIQSLKMEPPSNSDSSNKISKDNSKPSSVVKDSKTNGEAKKSCEEFKDPEEAFQTGVCVFKSKDAENASKVEKIAKIAEIHKEVEKLKTEKSTAEDEKVNLEKNSANMNPKAEEKIIKEDENTQLPLVNDSVFASKTQVKEPLTKNLASEKADSDKLILELIGTKLEKKSAEKDDDSIQRPTLISPVV